MNRFLVNSILCMTSIICIASAMADTIVRPNYPGTSVPNRYAPSVVEQDGLIYQTYPGTYSRDYSKPAYKEEDNTYYPVYSGTSVPNRGEQSYSIEHSGE